MYSYVTYSGNGVQTDFAVPFPYLLQPHVEASVAGVDTPVTFVNPALVRFAVAPASEAEVVIRRNSNRTARIVDFSDSSTLASGDLDLDSTQLMYVAQEALDQGSTAGSFSADANGSRVINVADPVLDADAVTKGWLADYLADLGVGGAGTDIRPLNNVGANAFTGNNEFTGTVAVNGATFNGGGVATADLLKLEGAGLFIDHETNLAAEAGFGHVVKVQRASGLGMLIGSQVSAIAKGAFSGEIHGAELGAWRMKGSSGPTKGSILALINTNANDQTATRIGSELRFMNREEGAATGGDASVLLGQSGDGTGGNWYNANSEGMRISAQARSDANATFVGWLRAFRFYDGWADNAKVAAYSGATQYYPGDYAISGGRMFVCLEPSLGNAPVAITGNTWWGDLNNTTGLKKAIGIDLSSCGGTTASRIAAGVKLRGNMAMLWDTEEHVSTLYDTVTGQWRVFNNGFNAMGVDTVTGDILVGGERRILGTRSSVSAHRNLTPQAVGAGAWTPIAMTVEERDTRGEYNPGSGVWTCSVAGNYDVHFQAQTDAVSTTGQNMYAGVYKNGVLYKASAVVCTAGRSNNAIVTVFDVPMAVSDTISTYVFCPATGVTITGEPGGTYLFISKRA